MARWFRRIRSTLAGAVLLYAVLAAGVMWPYRGASFRAAGDLDAFVAGVAEARNALRGGQFPIRITPHQLDGTQYPLFQFYANFPYTVAGGISALAGVNAYAAWKIAMLAAMTAGGTFTYLTAYRLTRRAVASAIAGAAFVLAPYFFTDLNARGAIAELFAVHLLPSALYATLRCLGSPRKRFVVACAVAWALVGMTHNITYLFGTLLIGAFTLSMLGRARRTPRRLLRLTGAGVLHAGLMAWYVVPQLQVLSQLEMHSQIVSPTGAAGLTPADILFAPVLRSPPGASTPNLGLQVGWTILAGVVLAICGLIVARARERRLRRVTVRLLALFAVALVMAWSPLGVWDRVPRVLWFIQFPYRLLGFATLFGALLLACGLKLCFGNRRGRGLVAFVALAAIGATAISYEPRAGLMFPRFVADAMKHPVCGGLNDYLLIGSAIAATGYAHPDVDLSRPAYGLLQGGGSVAGEVREHATAALNIPDGATSLHLLGSAENAGDGMAPDRVEVTLGPRAFTVPLLAGNFDFHFPLDPAAGSSQVVSLRPRDHVDRHVRMLLTSVRYEGVRPPTRRLITAEEIMPRIKLGRIARYRFESADPVLLQLPILFYPGMQRVRDNDRPLKLANLGRYVAVELPPGKHSIAVRFVGVMWANHVTDVAWGVVGLSIVLVGVRAIRERRRGRHTRPMRTVRHSSHFRFRQAITACAAIGLGGWCAWAARAGVERAAGARGAAEAIASRSNSANPAANAVDGRLNTAWHVDGPDPAHLTISLPAPRTIHGVRLHARRTMLYEVWQQVNVACYLADWPAVQQKFALADAAKQNTTEIHFSEPITVDRLELEFFDPVIESPDGTRVLPQQVNPGYAEVEVLGPAK